MYIFIVTRVNQQGYFCNFRTAFAHLFWNLKGQGTQDAAVRKSELELATPDANCVNIKEKCETHTNSGYKSDRKPAFFTTTLYRASQKNTL